MSTAFDHPHRSSTAGGAAARALCWLDCQAGTTGARLAADTGVGEAAVDWPPALDAGGCDVVLVCRATVEGLRAAVGRIDQYSEMGGPGRLVGLVCVAATEAVPATVADHLDLIAGAGIRVWRLGWGAVHTDPAMLGAMMTADSLRWVVQRSRASTAALGWTGRPPAVAS